MTPPDRPEAAMVLLVKVAESYGTWGGTVSHTPCAPPQQLQPVMVESFTEAATIDCTLCGSQVRVGKLKPDAARKVRRKHLPLGINAVAASAILLVFAVMVVASSAVDGGRLFFAAILFGLAVVCGAFAYSELSVKAHLYRMEMVATSEQPCKHSFRLKQPKRA